jgi:hypothetical protein
MKKTTLKTILKNVVFIALTSFLVLTFSSCATRVKFATSSVVPAARGDVKIKKDKNNNYIIKIEITNLAEVSRLQQSRQSYVVWLVSEKDETKNIGRIKSSSGMFSSKLKASFETVTSYKPTKIFITAEDDGAITYPSTQVVIATERF